MNSHLNILSKQASFDLKCCKMRWRLGLCHKKKRWPAYDAPQTP